MKIYNPNSTIVDPEFKAQLQVQSHVEQHDYITRYMALVLEEKAHFDDPYSYLHNVSYLYRKLDQLKETLEPHIIDSYPKLQQICEKSIFYLLMCSEKIINRISETDFATSYWKPVFKLASEQIQNNLNSYDEYIFYLEKNFHYHIEPNILINNKKKNIIELLKHTYDNLIANDKQSEALKIHFLEFSVWLNSFYEKEKLALCFSHPLLKTENKKSKI